jgi:hypothetical protein
MTATDIAATEGWDEIAELLATHPNLPSQLLSSRRGLSCSLSAWC